MVKAIADLHGATISLRDNGPGLVVQIDFPNSVTDEKSPPAEVSYAGGEGRCLVAHCPLEICRELGDETFAPVFSGLTNRQTSLHVQRPRYL